jgi:endonuclease G
MVKKGSASLADYLKSGYDRGHLALVKALSYSKESMKASFFLSNMNSQVSMFNRGIWRFLEAQVYQWSKESDSLYLVTGPILDHPIGIIGKNNVSVPRSDYKTIVRFKDNKITGIGFLLKNETLLEGLIK